MSSNYRDTISSGSTYYNNQFRDDPGARLHHHQKGLVGYVKLDSMETKQQHLERQVLAEFQKNHAQVPEGRIIIVAQVGRYMILALILPPYYLLYEGPKWILISLLPFIQEGALKASELLLFISTQMLHFFSSLGKSLQIFKKPKNFIKQKIELFGEFLFQRKEFLVGLLKFMHPLSAFKNSIKEKLLHYKIIARDFPLRLQAFLKERLPDMRKKLTEQAFALLEKAIQWKAPILLLVSVVKPVIALPAKYIIQGLQFLMAQNLKGAAKIKRLVDHAITPLYRVAAEKMTQISSAIYKKLAPPLTRVKIRARKIVTAAVDAVAKGAEALSKAAQNAMIPLVLPLQRSFFWCHGMFQKGSGTIFEKTAQIFTLAKGFIAPLKRVFKTAFEGGKKGSKQAFAKMKKWGTAFKKKAQSSFFWFIDKVRKTPSHLFKLWNKIKSQVVKSFKKTIWAFRMILAWTKILVINSLHNLRVK